MHTIAATCACMHTHEGAKHRLNDIHTVAGYMRMLHLVYKSHQTFWVNF